MYIFIILQTIVLKLNSTKSAQEFLTSRGKLLQCQRNGHLGQKELRMKLHIQKKGEWANSKKNSIQEDKFLEKNSRYSLLFEGGNLLKRLSSSKKLLMVNRQTIPPQTKEKKYRQQTDVTKPREIYRFQMQGGCIQTYTGEKLSLDKTKIKILA